MFQGKLKKVLATVLIVCMTISQNSFATLADSASDAYEMLEQSGSQENTTNYYYEYKKEQMLSAGLSGDDLLIEENDDGNIVLDEDNTIVNDSEFSDGETSSMEELDDDEFAEDSEILIESEIISPDMGLFSDDESNINSEYAEEPEEDIITSIQEDNFEFIESEEFNENEEDAENSHAQEEALEENPEAESIETTETTEIIDNEETVETIESTEIIEDIETSKTIEIVETVSETEIDIDIETSEISSSEEEIINETTIDTMQTETEFYDEISTQSVANEIIIESEEESISTASTVDDDKSVESTEDIETEVKYVKRYINSTKSDAEIFEDGRKHNFVVKEILLEKQDGSIVEAKSTAELEENYLTKSVKVKLVDQFGNEKIIRVDAKWNHEYYDLKDEHHMALKEEREQAREQEKIDEKEIVFTKDDFDEVNADIDEVNADKEVDETVADALITAFTNTENLSENDDNANNDSESVIDSINEGELDTESDEQIVYIDVLVDNNGENEEKENPIVPDNGDTLVDENNADSIILNTLDEDSLLNQLAGALTSLGGEDFTIAIDKDIIDDNTITIFGLTHNHGTHAICGMNNCDRNHYRYTSSALTTYDVNTNVKSKVHQNVTYNDLANDPVYLRNGGNWALTEDLTINSVIEVSGSLNLCLGGHNITFGPNGSININYSSANFVICNCGSGVSTATSILTGGSGNFRNQPAIQLNSRGDFEIYGMPGTQNIEIKDFYNQTDGDYSYVTNADRKAGFAYIYALNPALPPTGRIVSICDIKVSNCRGTEGGFLNAQFVDSFMSCGVSIDTCRAFIGAAYCVNYYHNTSGSSSGNSYFLFVDNEIERCQAFLKDNSEAIVSVDTYPFSNSRPNGIVVVSDYSSVQDVTYRQIRGNVIDNNVLTANVSAFHFNSSCENTTTFYNNQISYNCDVMVNDSTGTTAPDTISLARAAAGVTFSCSDINNSNGAINFSGNKVYNNYRLTHAGGSSSGAGGASFINVGTVNLNDQTDVMAGGFKPYFNYNFSNYRGGAIVFEKVKLVEIRTTKFSYNSCILTGEELSDTTFASKIDAGGNLSNISECFGGGAIFMYDVETANIGYSGELSAENVVEFDSNTTSYNGGAVAAYGTNIPNVNQALTLWSGDYRQNLSGVNVNNLLIQGSSNYTLHFNNDRLYSTARYSKGGALYIKGVYSANLNGASMMNNIAPEGSAICIWSSHKVNTSYFPLVADVLTIRDNGKTSSFVGTDRFPGVASAELDTTYTNCVSGGAISLHSIGDRNADTADVDISYTDILNNYATNGAGIYIYDEEKVNDGSLVNNTVALSYTEISNNGNTTIEDGGAIYFAGINLDLKAGVDIKQNYNALWLGEYSNLTTEYNKTQRGTSATGESGDFGKVLIYENTGDYVIGFNNFNLPSTTSSENREIKLLGGAIYENSLTAVNGVSGSSYDIDYSNGSATYRIGIFESNSQNGSTKQAVNIIFGGAIEVHTNIRNADSTVYQDIPLEQTTTDNHLFNLSANVEVGKLLYHNCILGFTPFNLTYATTTGNPTNEYKLFQNDATEHFRFNTTWIEGVDTNGVPSEMFINNREHSSDDKRKTYVDTNALGDAANTISFVHESQLVEYNFEMLNHQSDMLPFASQFIKTGGLLYQPAKPNALSDDGSLRYNSTGTVRAFDVMGFQGTDNNRRFAPWDFSQPALDPVTYQAYAPNELYIIYQLLDHKHKVCGNTSDVCGHINNDLTHTVYYGDPDFQFEGQSLVECRSIEVGDARQLFYAKYHPEYMYVLSNDIVIDSEYWGRSTDGILNDINNPINGLKLCLNGYSLTIRADATHPANSIFSLTGNSYICNCGLRDSSNGNVYASLGYQNSVSNHNYQNGNVLFTTSATTPTKINFYGHNYNGGNASADGYIHLNNISVNESESFVQLTNGNDEFVMDYVDLSSANSNDTLIETSCSTYISNSKFVSNEVKHTENAYLILIKDDFANSKSSNIIIENNEFRNNNNANNLITDSKNQGLIQIDTKLPSSVLTCEENHFVDNAFYGQHSLVNLSKSAGATEDIVRFENIYFAHNSFSRNKGGCIYTKGVQANEFNFYLNEYRENYLNGDNRLQGAAVCIEDVGAYGAYNIGAVVFSQDIFEDNYCGDSATSIGTFLNGGGGAVAFINSQAVTMRDMTFKGNKAGYGSAIYDSQVDGSQYVGDRIYDNIAFRDNGYTTSHGTYYINNAPANKEINTTFEDETFIMSNNIGEVSGFYIADFRVGSKLIFDANSNLITNNGVTSNAVSGGGSVFYVEPQNKTINNMGGLVRFNPGVTFNITDNHTGSSNAIQLYDNQIGDVDWIINFELANKIKIYDNKNDANEQSNLYVNGSFAMSSYDLSKLNVSISGTSYNSLIGVNGDYNVINNLAEREVNIFKWIDSTINSFGAIGVMSEEVFVIDEKAQNAGLQVYKGNDDYITIGVNDNCKELMVYLDDTNVYTAKPHIYVKYDTAVYLDYFADVTSLNAAMSNNIRNNFTNPSAYIDGTSPFMSTDYLGVQTIWNFSSNRFMASRYDDTQRVNVVWSCQHGHDIRGGMSTATWVIAFDSQILNISKDMRFVLANDIYVNETIENTNAQYGICLNGHNIYRNNGKRFVSLTGNERHIITIINCSQNGKIYGLNPHDTTNMTASTSVIYLEGSQTANTSVVNLINVNFTHFNHDIDTHGNKDIGALIHINYGTLNAQSCRFLGYNNDGNVVGKTRATTDDYAIYLYNTVANFSVNTNANINPNDRTIFANMDTSDNTCGDSFVGHSFLYSTAEYHNTRQNISFAGKTEVSNIISVNTNGALINLDYAKDFSILGDTTITNNENVPIFYIDKVDSFKIKDGDINISNNTSQTTGVFTFGNNELVDMDVEIGSNITGNYVFNNNTSIQSGALIYYENINSNTNIFDMDLYATSINSNSSSTGSGGAIYFSSTSSNISVARKNIITLNVHSLNNNTSIVKGGAIYAEGVELTINAVEIRQNGLSGSSATTEQGGFIYLKSSNLLLGTDVFSNNMTISQNRSINGGSAIYAASNYDANLSGTVTIGNNASHKVIITDNYSDSDTGAVFVEQFTNFVLDGCVEIYANGTATSHAEGQGHTNFYANVLDSGLSYGDAHVSRLIGANFDYDNSKIYATTEYYDEKFVSNFTADGTRIQNIFKKDKNYDAFNEPISVYTTGIEGNYNIHIGSNKVTISFYLGSGATAVHSGTTYTANADGIITEMNQTTGFGSSVNIGDPRQAEYGAWSNFSKTVNVGGVDYDAQLIGFVTYCYDVNSDNYNTMKDIDFNNDSVYILTANENFYAVAVWGVPNTLINMKLCGIADDESCATHHHNGNIASLQHDTPNYWILVDRYEQLFFPTNYNGQVYGHALVSDVRDLDNNNHVISSSIRAEYIVMGGGSSINTTDSFDININNPHGFAFKHIFKKSLTDAGVNLSGNRLVLSNYNTNSNASLTYTGTIDISDTLISVDAFETYGVESGNVNINRFQFDDNVATASLIETEILNLEYATIDNNTNGLIKSNIDSTLMFKSTITNNNIRALNETMPEQHASLLYMVYPNTLTTTYGANIVDTNISNNNASFIITMESVNVTAANRYIYLSGSTLSSNTAPLTSFNSAVINCINKPGTNIGSTNNTPILNIRDYVDNASTNRRNSTITGNSGYNYIVNSFGTAFSSSYTDITNNTVKDDIINISHTTKRLKVEFINVNITGNTNNGTGTDKYVLYKDVTIVENLTTLRDVNISNNNGFTKAVFLDGVGEEGALQLENTVIIYNNRDSSNNQANLYLQYHDVTNPANSVCYNSLYPISSSSKIGVSIKDMVTDTVYISNGQWTNTGAITVKDEATTHNIFRSDDDNYIIYRENTSIMYGATTAVDVTEVHYEYYGNIVNTPFEYQNIVDGTHADNPGVPIAADGVDFLGWYYDKDFRIPYVWTDADLTSRIVGEGAPKVATLYALWDRNIEFRVHKNDNLTDRDSSGQEYPHISQDIADGNNSLPYNVKYLIPMGMTLDRAINENRLTLKFYNDDAFSDEVVLTPGTYRMQKVTYIRSQDVLTDGGWWTQNGWNNGLNDGDYGEQFDYTDETEGIAKYDKDLYVAWLSSPIYVAYNLNANYSSTRDLASISMATSRFYYHFVITDNVLANAQMPGYRFKGWYTDPVNQTEANWVRVGTPCFISEGTIENPCQLYGRWEPIQYTVEIVPYLRSENPNDIIPPVDPYVATYTQIATFDQTFRIIDNQYTRLGKKELAYTYYDLENNSMTVDVEENIRPLVDVNLTDVDNGVACVYLEWDDLTYELTFDVNDGDNGYFIGTTTADSDNESIDIRYGQVLSNAGVIPNVSRDGYQFDGWWVDAACQTVRIPTTATYSFSTTTVDVLGREGFNIKVATNSRLYAKWIKNKYNILFDKNQTGLPLIDVQGTMSDANRMEATFDESVTIPLNAYWSYGYTYNGLYNDANDLYLYNDTSAITTDINTTPYNYNIGTPRGDGIASGSDVVLLAQWTEHMYDIVYHVNTPSRATRSTDVGSNKTYRETYYYSDPVSIIDGEDIFSVNGYVFMYFTSNPDGTGIRYTSDISTRSLAGKEPNAFGENQVFNLYAQWRRSPYYVNYIGGDASGDPVVGSLNQQTLSVGDDPRPLYSHSGGPYDEVNGDTGVITTVDSGAGFSALGYHFGHWIDSDGNEYADNQLVRDLRTEAEEEIELEAVWEPNTYQLQFDYNPPSSPVVGTTNEVHGLSYYDSLPANDPNRNIMYNEDYTLDEAYYFESEDNEVYAKVNGYTVDYLTGEDGAVYTNLQNTFDRKAGTVSETGSIYRLTYHWTPRTYTFAYDLNDADPAWTEADALPFPADVDVVYDNHFTLGIPERPGYEFDCWTMDRAYRVDETPNPNDIITTESILRKYVINNGYVGTLYAHWKPKTYKFTLNANTRTGVRGNAQTGYYYVASGSELIATTTITKNVQYEQPVGELLATLPELSGYHFTNVYTDDVAGEGDIILPTTTLWQANDNVVVYANYAQNRYQVHFLASDSEVENLNWATQSILNLIYDDEPSSLPEVVETNASRTFKLKGFTFDGWEHINRLVNASNSNTYNNQFYNNGQDVINLQEEDGAIAYMKAKWRENTYTVSFDSNEPVGASGLSNTPQELSAGGNTPISNIPYRAEFQLPKASWSIVGYEFTGWNTRANGTGTHYDELATVSRLAANVYGQTGVTTDYEFKLYAEWKPLVFDLYLDLNDVTTNHYYAGSTTASYINPNQSSVLKIQYDSSYKDAYIVVNNATISQSVAVEVRDIVAEREGYEFLGFAKTASISMANRAGSLISLSDYYRIATISTVYATWRNKEYTLRFVTDTNSYIPDMGFADQVIHFDAKFGRDDEHGQMDNLPEPSQPPYTFNNWYLDSWDFSDDNYIPSDHGLISVLNTSVFDRNYLHYAVAEGSNQVITLNASWFGQTFKVVVEADYEHGGLFDEGIIRSGVLTGNMVATVSFSVMYGTSLDRMPIDNPTDTTNPYRLHLWDYDEANNQGAVVKRGHTFLRWYNETYGEDENGYIPIKSTTSYWDLERGATISALWEANTYKVRYHFQRPANASNEIDSSIDDNAEQEFIYGETYNQDDFATMDLVGWTFKGWYTEPTETAPDGIWFKGDRATQSDWVWDIMPSEFYGYETDTYDLYAIWVPNVYTLTWDLNQGIASSVATFSNGSVATTSQVFDETLQSNYGVQIAQRDGYDFDGFYNTLGNWVGGDDWYESDVKNGSDLINSWEERILDTKSYGTVYANGEDLATNSTYYAKWSPKEYTITFDGNKQGSSSDAWQPIIDGTPISKTRKVIFDDLLGTERNRYSIYRPNHPYSYPTEHISGSIYPNTSMKGYTFNGWNSEQDGSGINITTALRFVTPSDARYYAQWIPNNYTITFDPNDTTTGLGGGSTIAVLSSTSMTITYDTMFGALPTVDRPGYEFMGWYAKNPWANGGDQIYSATSYDHLWGEHITDITVFNLDLMALQEPNELNNERDIVANTVRNITLYARYRRKQYKVVYYASTSEAGNGSTLGDMKVEGVSIGTTSYTISPVFYDLNILIDNQETLHRRNSSILPTVTRIGYTFRGWSKDSDINNVVNSSTVYRDGTDEGSELSVYALWRANTWNVIYGRNIHQEIAVTNSAYGLALPHSRLAGETDSVHPLAQNFNVVFDQPFTDLVDVGNANAPVLYSVNGTTERQGNDFAGWMSRAGNNNGVQITNTTLLDMNLLNNADSYNTITNTITIYAQWTPHTYTVHFDKNLARNSGVNTMNDLTNVSFNELRPIATDSTTIFSEPGFDLAGFDEIQITDTVNPTPTYPILDDGTVPYEAYRLVDTNAGETTLYAAWKLAQIPITYKNATDSDGTAIPWNKKLNPNLPYWYTILPSVDRDMTELPDVEADEVPFRSGYSFTGWILPDGSTTSNAVNIGDITSSYSNIDGITVYAMWEKNINCVILNANGGTGRDVVIRFRSSTSYTFTDDIRFRKDGHTIHGYCTRPTGEWGTSFGIGQTVPMSTLIDLYNANDGELTLYAIWTDRRYSSSLPELSSHRGSRGGGGGGGGGGGAGISLNNLKGVQATQQITPLAGAVGLVSPQPSVTSGNWIYEASDNSWHFAINSNVVQFGVANANKQSDFAKDGWYCIAVNNGNKWYKFDGSGKMQTGFVVDGDKIYYLALAGYEIGQMQVGLVNIGGIYFYFNQDGSLLVNGITPEGFKTDEIGRIIA